MSSVSRYFALHAQNLVATLGRLARQPFATTLTVLVIAIALALPAALRVVVDNVGALSSSWQSAADFSVYLGDGVSTRSGRSSSPARSASARTSRASR
jgi:cell division transport system permease protein